ncbi:MAG: hypothetical protein LBF77_08300, partial [Spirochaetaceae bacterium]|nr:hypothetical protein [Spirochaetaceae bacterium]
AAGINWERVGIFATRNTLSIGAAAQFDLNGNDRFINSQYIEARLDMPLGGSVNVEFGGVVELAQASDKSFYAAFAVSTEILWTLPTALRDRLAFAGWFSSGDWNDRLGVFIPLTMQARGKALRPESSGIALVETTYTLGFYPRIAADLSGGYYFRTDMTSFYHREVNPFSASPLLGGELYGGLVWAPFSDLLVSAGGGVFFPGTGKVFTDNADLIYSVLLTASVSL